MGNPKIPAQVSLTRDELFRSVFTRYLRAGDVILHHRSSRLVRSGSEFSIWRTVKLLHNISNIDLAHSWQFQPQV
jgi:hypothetical protein